MTAWQGRQEVGAAEFDARCYISRCSATGAPRPHARTHATHVGACLRRGAPHKQTSQDKHCRLCRRQENWCLKKYKHAGMIDWHDDLAGWALEAVLDGGIGGCGISQTARVFIWIEITQPTPIVGDWVSCMEESHRTSQWPPLIRFGHISRRNVGQANCLRKNSFPRPMSNINRLLLSLFSCHPFFFFLPPPLWLRFHPWNLRGHWTTRNCIRAKVKHTHTRTHECLGAYSEFLVRHKSNLMKSSTANKKSR